MYVPRHFAEDRLEVLHATIAQTGLATLVTLGADGLTATHLPLVLDPAAGELGTLYGHVALGNPQWREFDPTVQALAMFLGPEAYVSPSWYATKQETGKVVPTWNYLTVHAYGTLRTFDDPERLRAHVERLTLRQEGPKGDAAWHVSDAPADFVDGMLKGIVGLELPIARLQGKWKMSQNRPEADRTGAIAGLEATAQPPELAVAQVMRALYTD
jgi:transcriptional regulator